MAKIKVLYSSKVGLSLQKIMASTCHHPYCQFKILPVVGKSVHYFAIHAQVGHSCVLYLPTGSVTSQYGCCLSAIHVQ